MFNKHYNKTIFITRCGAKKEKHLNSAGKNNKPAN